MVRNHDKSARLGELLESVTEYGTRTAEQSTQQALREDDMGAGERKRSASLSAGMATLVSIVALLFSGFSFYETVLKQASLRFYSPPLIHMYREGFRDVIAIPLTISNDGAQRGTVLSFDLSVTNLKTNLTKKFQNLHFGDSPKGDKRLFQPITIPGRSSFTDVVLFYALETGAFVETTGGVELPLRLTLKMNLDRHGGIFDALEPKPLTFDMTASYIASFREMESGRPTRLHDQRWQSSKKKKANKE